MGSFLYNFLLIKYQLVTLSSRELIDLYCDFGGYQNFLFWVSTVAKRDPNFFLLHSDVKEKFSDYLDCYRTEYNDVESTTQYVNLVIRNFNQLKALSEREKQDRAYFALYTELTRRGYSMWGVSYRYVDFSWLYFNDVVNLEKIQKVDIPFLLNNPFFSDTVHYLLSVPNFVEEEREMCQVIWDTLQLAQESSPDLERMTKKDRKIYQKSVKSEIRSMKKLGFPSKK